MGLDKTKEHLAKLEETVIFFLLKASVINLRRWFLARGTLTFKFSVILNCGPPNLLSAYFFFFFTLLSFIFCLCIRAKNQTAVFEFCFCFFGSFFGGFPGSLCRPALLSVFKLLCSTL